MVEKMKLLHITGPKNDIDRVMEQYLSRYEIHFENAASGFGISGHVRPFAETNIYKDAYTKAQALWEHLKDEPGGAADYAMPVKMEPAEAEKVVEAAYRLTDEIVKRQEEVREERLERGFSPALRTLTLPSASTTNSTQEQPSSSPRKSRISLGIVTCPLMVRRCDICLLYTSPSPRDRG